MGDRIVGGTGNIGHLFECETDTDVCTDLGQAIGGIDRIGALTSHNGLVYGGTALYGLLGQCFVYDPETGEVTTLGYPAPGSDEWYINTLVTTPSGQIYGGTGPSGHLFSYNPASGQFADVGDGAPGDEIDALAVGPDGKLYGGSEGGYLFKYDPDPDRGTFEDLGQPVPGAQRIYGLVLGSDGMLHGGTGRPLGRVFSYDLGSGAVTDMGRAVWGSDDIYALLRSTTGTIYGGGGQLFAYDPANHPYRSPGTATSTAIIPALRPLADAPNTYEVYALTVGQDGRVYGGGGYEGQFFAYDPATGAIVGKWQAAPPERYVYSLTTGADGKIYGGTSDWFYHSGRLFVYDPVTGDPPVDLGQAIHGISGVYALTTGTDGRIYGGTDSPIGSSAHLFAFDPTIGLTTTWGVAVEGETVVTSLATGNDGRIYGGTGYEGYLFSYNPATGSFSDPLPTPGEWNEVNSIAAGADGRIYAGLGDDGHLLAYDPDSGNLEDLGQPVEGGYDIVALVATGELIYGISIVASDGPERGLLFAYDTIAGTTRLFGQPLPYEWYTLSLAASAEGEIYGGTGYNHGFLFAYEPSYPFEWGVLDYTTSADPGTAVTVDVLDLDGVVLLDNVTSGGSLASLNPAAVPSIMLRAELTTSAEDVTPHLLDWSVAWPTIEVTPPSLSFLLEPDDPDTASQQIQIHSSVGETVTWTVSVDQPSWLSCQPASGTTPDTINVTVDKTYLDHNTWYSGVVTVDWSYAYATGSVQIDISLFIGAHWNAYLPLVTQAP